VRENELRDSWFWVHPANQKLVFKQSEFTFRRTTNSLGLSDEEWLENDSSFTVLGLGDSFTEGTGVDSSATWLKVLESELVRTSDFPIKTMNAGVGGSDPVFEYLLFEKKLLPYLPEFVILSVNSSDLYEIGLRGGFERFKEDGTTGRAVPKWESWYQRSHVFRFFIHAILNYNENLIPRSEALENRKRFVSLMKTICHKMDSLAATHDFEFLVVVHPISIDFRHEEYIDAEMNELVTFLSKSEFSFVDVRDEFGKEGFRTEEDVEAIYWPVDRHFNEKGYRLYAKFLFDSVLAGVKRYSYQSYTTTQKHPQLSQGVQKRAN
jgi:lysophospholipase L1-like esterase